MKRLSLALALLALAPTPALAQTVPAPRLVTQFTEAGDPEVRVSPIVSGSTLEAVRRCPPGGAACEPMSPASLYGAYLAGETPAGTVFEADIKDAAGGVTTLRSVAWRGRVTATSPPSLSGEAKVGGTVTPAGGTWGGGWGDRPGWSPENPIKERTYSGVIACRTPERTDCWQLLDGPLAQRWGGWYLFAASTRFDGDMTGRPVPAQALWPFPSRTDARELPTRAYSAPVQVCCTLPAPAVTREVTLRKKAHRGGGRITVGRVTCSEPCEVTLRVSGGNRKPTVRRFTAQGTRALEVPARRGKLRVRVQLDGQLSKSGHVRA